MRIGRNMILPEALNKHALFFSGEDKHIDLPLARGTFFPLSLMDLFLVKQ